MIKIQDKESRFLKTGLRIKGRVITKSVITTNKKTGRLQKSVRITRKQDDRTEVGLLWINSPVLRFRTFFNSMWRFVRIRKRLSNFTSTFWYKPLAKIQFHVIVVKKIVLLVVYTVHTCSKYFQPQNNIIFSFREWSHSLFVCYYKELHYTSVSQRKLRFTSQYPNTGILVDLHHCLWQNRYWFQCSVFLCVNYKHFLAFFFRNKDILCVVYGMVLLFNKSYIGRMTLIFRNKIILCVVYGMVLVFNKSYIGRMQAGSI